MLVVTKTRGVNEIAAVLAAGVRDVGESRIQEFTGKWRPRSCPEEPALIEATPVENCPNRGDVRVALVGHLQSNKAKLAASYADTVSSIDKAATARALSKRVEVRRDVLVQMNTSGEASKYGVADADEAVYPLVEAILNDPMLRLRGLMTIAPFVDDERPIRACFVRLRNWFDQIATRYAPEAWDTLSMGMSGDLEIAIKEGSTEVRPGTAIFGPRPQ